MSISVKRLLNASESVKSDGLSQGEREAIVDLLHYCMYADNFVAITEDQFINATAATLSWDKNISFESFEGGSIGRARKAKENGGYRDEFLKGIAGKLASKSARQLAFDLCAALYKSDANLVDKEAEQLSAIKALLKV
jgi:hypothetical protein